MNPDSLQIKLIDISVWGAAPWDTFLTINECWEYAKPQAFVNDVMRDEFLVGANCLCFVDADYLSDT